jgi:hypothetical protein
MKTFAATSIIRAPAHVIWSILMDSPRWTEWDPSLDRIEGRLAPVARLDPDRGMTWRGGMPLPFLFKGERTFAGLKRRAEAAASQN